MTNRHANPTSAAARATAQQGTDLRVINALLVLASVALFAGYLALNMASAGKGFAARSLEKRIAVLKEEQRKLDIAVVSNQTMAAVGARIEGLGFVPVTEVAYVNAVGGAVAIR